MALIMIMFAAGFQSEGLSILSVVMLVITIIYMILYAIITFIPNLAMTVRRFHDTDRTMFIPILSVVLGVISFYCAIDLEY